ncbi:BP74-related protein [Amycolatopsis magusensis]|uniref:BP74-related protein n=1 Tax=Amycolatopsis magusensis TaxID=882444 RepID=UPI0024A8FF7E|nr:hypothetical protein [Amycolatopsis magusensis]MDI5976733.1 hypothetical protein [Amycolatopsis magusensis]
MYDGGRGEGGAVLDSLRCVHGESRTLPQQYQLILLGEHRYRIDDADLIAHARRFLSGEVHVAGRIRDGIEIRDATMTYVEKHLDDVGDRFLPGQSWCAWTSRLTRELDRF